MLANKNDIVTILKNWEENGSEPTPEIINHVINACNEVIFDQVENI